MSNASQQILKGSSEGNKRYGFDDTHDPMRPAQFWFQESEDGLILFVVFYTQACRWSRCLGCNLPSQSSLDPVGFAAIIQQIDYLFSEAGIQTRCPDIDKIIISNNGSILDEQTFSSTALMYLMARINLNCPKMRILTLETRPEYVDLSELEFLYRALNERSVPTVLELAIGFEAYDDRIRNDHFSKGLSRDTFETMVERIAPCKHRLKCYLMQKPVPHMTDAQAIKDIHAAIDYLSDLAIKHGVSINMHLNPTYVAYGTGLEDSFSQGLYTPPRLSDVVKAIQHAQGKSLSVYVGLSDEGLAVPGGSFIRPDDERLVKTLELFNRTQDYTLFGSAV